MSNQPKCFVPGCNNDVGVLFPKNPIVKKKWLKSLGLSLNSNVDSKSFVCLDHFEEDGNPSALPKSSSDVSTIQNVSSNSSKPTRTDRPVTRNSQSGIDQKTNSDIKTPALKKYTSTECKSKGKYNIPVVKIEDKVDKFEVELPQEKKGGNSCNNLCRLCMFQSPGEMESVYNKIDEYTIAHMISVCLYPLKILPKDKLSKSICSKCIQLLKEYFKFHEFCVGMDSKQRELISIEQEWTSDGHNSDSDNSEEYLHVERLSDYEDKNYGKGIENKDNHRNEKPSREANNKFKNKSMLSESEIDFKSEELDEVLVGSQQPESKGKSGSKQFTLKQSTVNSKSSNEVAADIKDIGKDKDPEVYTENIIIEMVNDDDEAQSLIMPKLPITIKRINSNISKRKPVKRRRNNSNTNSSNPNLTMIKSGSNEEVVVLPSGIKVEVKEKYNSPLGVYASQTIKYVFNTEFIMAGGYLYEYWLAKDDIRNLHCIVSKCPGVAKQKRIDRKTFSDEIEVIKSHDHKTPDDFERKRQMFYNIMYGKMRRDRNFNFKLLYEQFCKLDTDLSNILPLRKVISEICKQGPTLQPPPLKSFDEFHDLVESDAFNKIHFTDNLLQFYQERFETDDGAKAVVFANPKIVEENSHSKLMYVDASFNIDSTDFPFKLVTVLIWVHESFYPILFAFVNRKSQELYKKIFGFLYSYLAPNLRPEEIITDYEAHLYYALGETYVESSIGGSMFYFTQNLYKKICALNLSRELDLNSNFRSIYNMLLMLPLLPVNTILDGLNNIEMQAKELGIEHLTKKLFQHVHEEWICNVTPEFFCVHRLENRINENIVAPFKKLRDLIMLAKSKSAKSASSKPNIVQVVEKILELEKFLRDMYHGSGKKTFAKDLSSSQKKIVLKAWNFIENHPKININHFFLKVLGYIKCMENQLWIWGFYRYTGDTNDELINANNFSIINDTRPESLNREEQDDMPMEEDDNEEEEDQEEENIIEEFYIDDSGSIRKICKKPEAGVLEEVSKERDSPREVLEEQSENEEPAVVMEAVIDGNGGFVLQNTKKNNRETSVDNNFFVYK